MLVWETVPLTDKDPDSELDSVAVLEPDQDTVDESVDETDNEDDILALALAEDE